MDTEYKLKCTECGYDEFVEGPNAHAECLRCGYDAVFTKFLVMVNKAPEVKTITKVTVEGKL